MYLFLGFWCVCSYMFVVMSSRKYNISPDWFYKEVDHFLEHLISNKRKAYSLGKHIWFNISYIGIIRPQCMPWYYNRLSLKSSSLQESWIFLWRFNVTLQGRSSFLGVILSVQLRYNFLLSFRCLAGLFDRYFKIFCCLPILFCLLFPHVPIFCLYRYCLDWYWVVYVIYLLFSHQPEFNKILHVFEWIIQSSPNLFLKTSEKYLGSGFPMPCYPTGSWVSISPLYVGWERTKNKIKW